MSVFDDEGVRDAKPVEDGVGLGEHETVALCVEVAVDLQVTLGVQE